MGSFRSKEDDVSNISTSIFVTNFLDSFSAKDLFRTCQQYGHVVDSFIHVKRSKGGKRFGFVNLCTIWVGRLKLHANVARFQRAPLGSQKSQEKKNTEGSKRYTHIPHEHVGISTKDRSFVNVLKGESDNCPAIVLENDCLLNKDMFVALMGRVNEFTSLSNIKNALTNEGFVDINIRYLGELWILLEFSNNKTRDAFSANVGARSWFSELRPASNDFSINGRIVWVEVEGVPFKLWCGNTFKRIALKWGKLHDMDDQEDNYFHSKRLRVHTKIQSNIFEMFKIIYHGKAFWIRAKEVPGWEPDFLEESDEDVQSEEGLVDGDDASQKSKADDNCFTEEVPDTLFDEPVDHTEKPSEDPFNIYPLLNKEKAACMDNAKECESLKYPPGFTPSGAANELGFSSSAANDHDINKECGSKSKENNESLQQYYEGNNSSGRTNDHLSDSNYSGRFKTSEIPRSGGSILSLMDELVRVGQTMGYRIEGCKNDITEIIESQGASMVRNKSKRFGSVFHAQAAEIFNSFIMNAGLDEVPLGGSAFTWCHRSASKMSKLDRFLVFENLLISYPNISAITLDRFLSDHRPIFLRGSSYDYGPSPFWFYHHWLEVDGFSIFVNDSWNEASEWKYANKSSSSAAMTNLKKELHILEEAIDKSSETIISKRLEVIDSIQRLNKISTDELPQKEKIKWNIHLDMSFPFSLSVEQQEELESMVTREELQRAVWDCGVNKYPGPDGFTFGFYRHFWSLIENDVFVAINHFYTYDVIPKGCNSSFIALIPKVPDANFVKDFLPISLIGSIYKIIAKILANRLVNVLDGIVNDVQSDFVAGRQMRLIGLDGITWMRFYPSLVSEASGVLGSVIAFVHQEVLFLLTVPLRRSKWCEGNINTLVNVFECFHRAFGLKINMSKSKLMGIHVEDALIKQAAAKLGCLTLRAPFTYLGLKAGGSMSRISEWQDVVDKVKARLSKWKLKTLSIGGRLTLLKSVLGSIPIFHISTYRVPKMVLHELESIRCHFFNGHDRSHRKASWTNKSTVITPKEKRGLGVASLYALNRGLMLKWLWRFCLS
nr:hydroxycinnamoyl-CoA quinate/shikimate transferase [Tanacetum cinerariifolium]